MTEITFAVSDVTPTDGRCPSTTLEKSLHARSQRLFEAAACNRTDLIESTAHGLVAAVHTAFARHHPLVLSPDDIWLCIAQGFATHIKLHAEALRGRFVLHEGQEKITVRRDDFVKGAPSNDWPAVFSELSDRIHAHIGKKRDLVVADFSTTGTIERAASEVVLFDALQSYFGYLVATLCGIPQITLLGTPDDWLWIRYKVEALAEFDLAVWTRALLPVVDRIVRTTRGDIDRPFWQSFYKRNDESGDPYVTGWINVLFPYVEALDLPTLRPKTSWNKTITRWKDGMSDKFGGGPAMHGRRSEPLGREFPAQSRGSHLHHRDGGRDCHDRLRPTGRSSVNRHAVERAHRGEPDGTHMKRRVSNAISNHRAAGRRLPFSLVAMVPSRSTGGLPAPNSLPRALVSNP